MRFGCCQSSIQMVLSQAITAATCRVRIWIETFTLMMTKSARNAATRSKCYVHSWKLSFPLSWLIDSKCFLMYMLTHVPQVSSHMPLNLSLFKTNYTFKDCLRFFTIRVRTSCSRTVGSPTTNIKRIVRGWLWIGSLGYLIATRLNHRVLGMRWKGQARRTLTPLLISLHRNISWSSVKHYWSLFASISVFRWLIVTGIAHSMECRLVWVLD